MPTNHLFIMTKKSNSNSCCICLEQCNNMVVSCNTCDECKVCNDCNTSLMENGQLDKCPVCRSKNWRSIAQKTIEEGVERGVERHSKCAYLIPIKTASISKFCLLFKCLFIIVITWSVGVCAMMIYYNDYYNHINLLTVLIPFLPGLLIIWSCIWCYRFHISDSYTHLTLPTILLV